MTARRPETRHEVYVAAYRERYGREPRQTPEYVTDPETSA